jgi:hypothetical protein
VADLWVGIDKVANFHEISPQAAAVYTNWFNLMKVKPYMVIC